MAAAESPVGLEEPLLALERLLGDHAEAARRLAAGLAEARAEARRLAPPTKEREDADQKDPPANDNQEDLAGEDDDCPFAASLSISKSMTAELPSRSLIPGVLQRCTTDPAEVLSCHSAPLSAPLRAFHKHRETPFVSVYPQLADCPGRLTSRASRGSHVGSTAQLFADVEDLKEQIRGNLTEAQPDLHRNYRSDGIAQQVARSRFFEGVSLLMVGLNSIWISIELDFNNHTLLSQSDPLFQVIAHIFCTYFVLELLIRFAAYKQKRHAFKEFWFMFDAALVCLIVFETWVTGIILSITDSAVGTGGVRMRMFSAFRMLRSVRALRIARVLRELPELLVIVRGIVMALRAIAVVLMLLGLVIYFTAIVFRVVLEDTPLGTHRFHNVPAAMGTLLLDVTLSGSKGGPLIEAAYRENPLYAVLLLSFVLLANVTVMGVLGGLLVQTVKTVAELEKEENSVKRMGRTMEHLWEVILDAETPPDDWTSAQHGFLSEGLLKAKLREGTTDRLLHSMGVDVEGLASVSGFLFEQHGGRLTRPQFKRMLLDLRGTNAAKVKDHVETRKFVHAQLKKCGLRATTEC